MGWGVWDGECGVGSVGSPSVTRGHPHLGVVYAWQWTGRKDTTTRVTISFFLMIFSFFRLPYLKFLKPLGSA